MWLMATAYMYQTVEPIDGADYDAVMALATTIINQIRDEIGSDLDVSDAVLAEPAPLGDLETIYDDENRGNSSVLRTALIVWKGRLANMQSRSFDATAGGRLLARSQRIRFLQRRVKELELLVDYTLVGVNQSLVTAVSVAEDAVSSEF